jgi:hypothetical protein
LQGVLGGYLIFNGTLTSGPQAVTVIEKVMSRQLGPIGREIINVAAEMLLTPPSNPAPSNSAPSSPAPSSPAPAPESA